MSGPWPLHILLGGLIFRIVYCRFWLPFRHQPVQAVWSLDTLGFLVIYVILGTLATLLLLALGVYR